MTYRANGLDTQDDQICQLVFHSKYLFYFTPVVQHVYARKLLFFWEGTKFFIWTKLKIFVLNANENFIGTSLFPI